MSERQTENERESKREPKIERYIYVYYSILILNKPSQKQNIWHQHHQKTSVSVLCWQSGEGRGFSFCVSFSLNFISNAFYHLISEKSDHTVSSKSNLRAKWIRRTTLLLLHSERPEFVDFTVNSVLAVNVADTLFSSFLLRSKQCHFPLSLASNIVCILTGGITPFVSQEIHWA